MRIGIIAPLVTPIREPQLGGSQSFLADLAVGLTVRSHDVHVYAAKGSEIPGVTVIDSVVDPAALLDSRYRPGSTGRGNGPVEAAFAHVYAAARTRSYDLVHNHAFDAPAISLATSLEAAVVHTLHLPPEQSVIAALEAARLSHRPPTVAAVSAFQADTWREVTRIDVVLPNGAPVGRIPWSEAPGVGAVFAGRLSPEKGVAEAMDIAMAAGVPLDVYGDAYDRAYAEERIYGRLGGPGSPVHAAVERRVSLGDHGSRRSRALSRPMGGTVRSGCRGSSGHRHSRCRLQTRRPRGSHHRRSHGISRTSG